MKPEDQAPTDSSTRAGADDAIQINLDDITEEVVYPAAAPAPAPTSPPPPESAEKPPATTAVPYPSTDPAGDPVEPVASVPAPLSPPSAGSSDDGPAFVPPPGVDSPAIEVAGDEAIAYIDGDDPLDHIDEKVAEEEAIFKRLRQRDRFSAIAIAAFAHLIIFFLLTIFIIYGPTQAPPEIIAIATEGGDALETPKQKVKRQTKQSKPSAQMTQVVSAVNFSSVTVPHVDTPAPEDLAVGLSTDDFGMGFTGLSEGGFIASLPAAMQGRCTLVDRIARLTESGGKRKCEEAVHKALVWLSEQQNDDGSLGKGQYPVAMTGLALLAYLGHCETPDSPEFADTVINATTYLMNRGIEGKGHMMSPKGKGAYEHAIATYALCELFTMTRQGQTKIPGLSDLLKDAVKKVIEGQNSAGGWDYNYKQGTRSDTSVAGWQIQALRAAKNTKIDYPGYDECWEKAIKQIYRVQGELGGFGYTDAEDKISLTGVGVLALQFDGQGADGRAQHGLAFIMEKRTKLEYGSANFYEWYYSTQACFLEGGKVWREWNDMFLDEMLRAQDNDGHFPQGRGNREDDQSKGDGDVYRTCLCTLMLEVYYRYLPTTAK